MSEITYRTPIYLQLRDVIRSKIEDGEYMPGTAIPSENELAETYGINRLTVRNAVDTLVNEGLLMRVQGKGVYVLGERVERDLDNLGGFTQTMLVRRAQPTTTILVKSLRKAGGKFAEVFGIDPQEDIYYIKRVCNAGGEPFSLEEVFIPQYIVPKLEGIDLSVFSIYEVYAFYGVELARAYQTMDLAYLNQSDARTLNIDKELAVLHFECTSYDSQSQVVEFSRSYTRADKCVFTVQFRK